MHIHINQEPHELPDGASLADAIALRQPRPPFAAAVNLQFVPRASYAQHRLQEGDRLEIIAPITGG
jgi:sulfur carrier protein